MFWKSLLAIFAIFVILMAIIVTIAVLEAFFKVQSEGEPDTYENHEDIF